MTNDWPCMQWTIDSLITKVGDNEVMIRGKTNKEGQAHDMFSRIFRIRIFEFVRPIIV